MADRSARRFPGSVSVISAYVKHIAAYRELIWTLTLKEINVKYKSAVLGWLWSILNPLLLMIIFTVVFTYVFKIDIEKPPLFLLAALIPQFFLNYALSNATTSIVDNAALIKTVYFPYEIIPLSVVLANFFNHIISLVLLVFFSLFFQEQPTPHLMLIPLAAMLQVVFVFGVCLLASALHTLFRDIKYAVELMQIIWFYATPIFYPLSMVPENVRGFFYLNPMTFFVEIYRDILLHQQMPSMSLWLGCGCACIVSLLIGGAIFARHRRCFVDVT